MHEESWECMTVCVFLLLKWKSCLVTKGQGSVRIMTLLSLCGNQSKQKRQRRTDSRTPWGVMSDGHWCIHSLFVRAVAFRSSSCWIIWAWCWCHVLFHKVKPCCSGHKAMHTLLCFFRFLCFCCHESFLQAAYLKMQIHLNVHALCS